MCSSSSVSRFLKRFSATKKSPPRPFDEKKERKRTPFSSFRRPLLKPLLPFCPRPTRSAEKKRKRGREGRDLLFDLLFASLSSSSSSERKRERCLHSFFFFFSLFLFCGGGETCDLFTSRRVSKDFERDDDDEWNCLEALDRHRTSISPRSLTSSTTTGGGEETARVVMRPRSGRCEASYRPRICA